MRRGDFSLTELDHLVDSCMVGLLIDLHIWINVYSIESTSEAGIPLDILHEKPSEGEILKLRVQLLFCEHI